MIYLFLADGFEEIEALATVDVLRRGGLDVLTAGVGGKTVTGSHNITVNADVSEDEILLNSDLQAVILPGGMPGTLNLEKSAAVKKALEYSYSGGGYVCAICAAPSVLGKRGMLKGKNATCFPGFEQYLEGANYSPSPVVTDGNVITAKGAGCAVDFGLAILSALLGADDAAKIRESMQCP